MYCKDCEWWKNKSCGNEAKLHENKYLNEDENIDELDYSYNEGGGFQTGPMFGCVHFRAMADKPQGGKNGVQGRIDLLSMRK